MQRRPLTGLLAMLLSTPALAQVDRSDIPPPPQIPYAPGSEELAEPQVTIIERDDRTIEEYRVNGRLVAVRVKPSGGAPAYYLVDTNGDGLVDKQFDRLDKTNNPAQWVILRF